jgi:hypothetical protein
MGKYEKLLIKKVGLVSTFNRIRIKHETVAGNRERSHHFIMAKQTEGEISC